MSETLREALTTIRDLTLDVPAAHGDPESYYLGQLRTAIGTAARALARSESPSPGDGLTEAAGAVSDTLADWAASGHGPHMDVMDDEGAAFLAAIKDMRAALRAATPGDGLRADPDEDVWKMLDGDAAWADQLTGEHVPHYGNHQHYACGFSGTHCWKCGEPWPCRTERGVTRGPARLAAALARSESPSPCDHRDEQREYHEVRAFRSVCSVCGNERLQRSMPEALAESPSPEGLHNHDVPGVAVVGRIREDRRRTRG